jgi:hypothetical protein
MGNGDPMMPQDAEKAGISSYWRLNRSGFEAVELANVLRAMRKVAGLLGPNAGRIEYTGMSRGKGAAIILEPSLVVGEYPIPPERVDYLVGLVTHEALHRIEWSDHVWKLLEPTIRTLRGSSNVRLQKIVSAGEHIYVDLVADRTVFGLYTPAARSHAFAEARKKFNPGQLSLDQLVYLWWTRTWESTAGTEPAEAYREPLELLDRLTNRLREVVDVNKGVTDRCEMRAELYLEAWESIRPSLSSLAAIDKTLKWYPDPAEAKPPAPARRSAAAKRPLSAYAMHQIELQLAFHSPDITSIIQSVVGHNNDDVVPTSRWDFGIPSRPVVDPLLVARLKSLFLNYASRKTVVSRGLLSGKVDRRRLYRAPVSGRCFHQKERLPELDWNVTLLMDASGSMRGNKWRMVENTVGNLHRALMGSRNHFQAYAYFEVDGVCMISQLIRNRQLLSVPPSGQTASGQAIIAVAYFMPKGRKRNLLIHVTDGESNLGCHVRYGIEYCRKQKIHLVTLGCAYKDREAMLRQYGTSLQFVDHYGQLPRAIERLLKNTFLYGNKPHLFADGRVHRTLGQERVTLSPNMQY